jgi:hypothetical protein
VSACGWFGLAVLALAQSGSTPVDASDGVANWRDAALEARSLDERGAALERLFQRGRADSDAALLVVLDRAEGEIGLRAARAVAQRAPLAAALLERVVGGPAAGATRAASAEVRSELLAAAGTRAAERAHDDPLARRALAALLAEFGSPDLRVARAARVGVERYLARSAELERVDAASAWLEQAAGGGLDPAAAHQRRARLWLAAGTRARGALTAAEALERALRGRDDPAAALARMQSAYLLGMARCASGDFAQARLSLELAIARANELCRERTELWPARDEVDERHVDLAVDRLEWLGVAHLGAIVAGLAAGESVDGAVLRAHALAAHEASLRAQIAAAAVGRGDGLGSLDDLLDRETAPRRLLLSNERSLDLPPRRALELLDGLYRVLGAIAPSEMPGFASGATTLDPLADPPRRALYEGIVDARLDGCDNAIARLRRAEVFDPLQALMLRQVRRDLADWRERALEAGGRELLEQRVPSTAALDLAALERRDGDCDAAITRCTRALADLERASWGKAYLWSPWHAARLVAARGAALTDAKKPVEAERDLLDAVKRLEELETSLVERRGDAAKDGQWARGLQGFVQLVRRSRAAVYVSLAVNANVRLDDQARALAYFEESWKLEPSEDAQILLACYRARSGDEQAARAALASVVVEPRHYYNLACTHALLGDHERAFEFLELEFAPENHSAGALARQKEWAAEDPDLARLRGSPRFLALVAPAANPGAR